MASTEPTILKELNVSKLPSLPHILVDMLNACGDKQSSFQNIAEITSRDAAIAARVISLANSSFYSRGHKINSLERALLVLGTDTLKMIVITASVQQFFSSFSGARMQYLKQFWERSLSCALLAKNLATLTSYANPEEAYLIGLLHNIGELVLETNHAEPFENLMAEDLDEYNRLTRESQLFGVNHCDVGAWLADEWNLNGFAADALRYHHEPSASVRDAHHLVKLIHVASSLSHPRALEENGELDSAHEIFDLNPALVTEIVKKIREEVVEVAGSLGIELDVANESTDQQQVELAKRVRNISLLQSATKHLSKAQSEEELNYAICHSLQLLFGYRPAYLFWHDNTRRELLLKDELITEEAPIIVKLADNRSLVASAAAKKLILCSLDQDLFIDGLPIVDQQLLSLLKSKGMLCLPVFDDKGLIAVVAAGIDSMPALDSSKQQLLTSFCDEVAKTYRSIEHLFESEHEQISISGFNERVQEIAHEANNPLNIIGNYLSTLSDKLGPNHEAQAELGILREEIDRTGDIILRLRDIEQDMTSKESGVDINNEIESLTTLYQNSLFLTHGIVCKLQLDDNMERNAASRNSLRQTLTNLIKNAVEAMPNGGQLSIGTTACVNVNGKDYAEITIKDTGSGIPLAILKDLFKPVVSTKGSHHSGLGLSITKNLITKMKGTISCRSSDKGTEFQIQLPISKTPEIGT